jgi:signal transduction histidine kinase
MSNASKHARIPDRWLDPALAALVLVALETEILTFSHRHGPLEANVLLLAAISLATVWRRRAPLAFACAALGLAAVMTATLTSVVWLAVAQYLLVVPAYTVGANEEGTRTRVGLVVCLAVPVAICAMTYRSDIDISNYLFACGAPAVSWGVGRALRARRQLNDELERMTYRLAAERESRELLAVADERTRIARELHAMVAGRITAMVVQTGAAQRLLRDDLDRADEAMAAVEAAGRQTLAEMRRILGVLRRPDETPELAPQPGVGQIHLLVQRARADHRDVEFEVDGEPGPLTASVDLGLYRILEEALATAGPGDMKVRLGFAEQDVDLQVIADGGTDQAWPTLGMRERVAFCDGELEAGEGRLRLRLPRGVEGAVPA